MRLGGQRDTGARALVLRGTARSSRRGSVRQVRAGQHPSGWLAGLRLRTRRGRDHSLHRGGRLSARASASDLALIDDRLLAAGRADGEFALARYRPGGRLDAGFSGDGKLRTDLPYESDAASRDRASRGTASFSSGHSTYYSLRGSLEQRGDRAIFLSEVRGRRRGRGPRSDRSVPTCSLRTRATGALDRAVDLARGGNGRTTPEHRLHSGGCTSGAHVTVYRVGRHHRTGVGAGSGPSTRYYGDIRLLGHGSHQARPLFRG